MMVFYLNYIYMKYLEMFYSSLGVNVIEIKELLVIVSM